MLYPKTPACPGPNRNQRQNPQATGSANPLQALKTSQSPGQTVLHFMITYGVKHVWITYNVCLGLLHGTHQKSSMLLLLLVGGQEVLPVGDNKRFLRGGVDSTAMSTAEHEGKGSALSYHAINKKNNANSNITHQLTMAHHSSVKLHIHSMLQRNYGFAQQVEDSNKALDMELV